METLAAMSGLTRLIFLVGIFVLIVISIMLLGGYITRRAAIRARVAQAASSTGANAGGVSLRADATTGSWHKLIESVEKAGLSLADTNDADLRAKLVRAGYTSPLAPRWYTLIRLIMVIALPALFLAVAMSSPEPPSLIKLYAMGSIFAVMGLYLPSLFVTARADRRQTEIVNGFPDALDLMLVCVEAGLGLEAAFDRVGREMMSSHPLLSNMLATVVLELRAGRSRSEALHRMADRAQIDEIRSFATLLIQSDKLGSSIGQTLRVYAAEMREKRRLRAEEKAHRLPVMLSIPLVACMLPVMIGVLMLPAGIRVIRQVLPAF